MGIGHSFYCEKCDHSYRVSDGVGFLFPMVYEETIRDGRAGKLGEEIKTFLEEHPDGALDAGNGAYRCNNCGNLQSEKVLTMYLPKDGLRLDAKDKGRWSVAYEGEGNEYVAPSELKEGYKFYKIHPHYCEQCGNRMKRLTEKEIKAGIRCPSCGEMMKEGIIFWD